MRIVFMLTAILTPLAVPVQVGAAGSSTAPGTGQDRVVCREMMRTGTRFKSKTCRTVAQWEKMTEENRKTASELIDRPFIFDCRKQGSC